MTDWQSREGVRKGHNLVREQTEQQAARADDDDETASGTGELPALRAGDRIEFERPKAAGLPYSVTVVRVFASGTHPGVGNHDRDSVVVVTPAGRRRTLGVHRLGLDDDVVRVVTTEEQEADA